jgi:hypothetical protein
MPYIINRYDGTELTVLEDGSINSATSLGLIGRNYFGYGEQQNENFVFLLENFANVNPPLRPLKGQAWYDTNENLLKVYNGTAWSVVGSAVVSETAPVTATIGSLWLKTPANILYAYNGNTWSFIGPETAEGFGTTRAESTTLLDSTNVQRPVILFKVNNKVTAIASEVAFTLNPSTPIDGFANISQGLTVSSLMQFRGRLDGTANRADQLQTTRLINGVGFNGTADISIKASTTNSLTPGNYVNGDSFNGGSPETWSIDATPSNTGGKIVARNAEGDFSARNITANLIGDVRGNVTTTVGTSFFNICYANRFEGAVLTGNADTATRLQTPRAINGVLFSGIEDIEVPSNAQTLTGTFIKSSVVGSNLQQVGTLQNLSVQGAGINIGNSTQKLRIVNTTSASIFSETGTLRIGSNANPEFNFLDAATAQSQGGPAGFSTFSPVGNSNIGLPSKKFNIVYANQVDGNSATATLASSANNLAGGAPGSLPYQSSTGSTLFLPAGTPGYVLKAANGNQIVWEPLTNERLNRGTYLNFTDIASNPVTFYNAQSQVTVSVDATPSALAGKVVARDGNGNFSTARITLTQTPIDSNHAVTKGYVDGQKFTITSGNTIYSTSGFTNQVGSWNNNANFFDVFPPSGKSMGNLVAFIPSIAVIHYAGGVDGNDSLRCTWSNLGDRIRVYVQNTEQRSTPAANYLAIWS